MSVTRYREGGSTVTVTGDLERHIRQALERAAGASLRVLEQGAEELAAKARADWYGPNGVTKRTGQSGDIQVVTTLDMGRGVVRVGIGSTDTRRDPKGRPLAVLVRRPGRTSLVKVSVTPEEFWATPANLRANWKPEKGDEGPGPFVFRLNPKASDGKTLLPEFVIKPGKLKLKSLVPALSAAFKGV